MLDPEDSANIRMSLAGNLFALAARAASIWCDDIEDELASMEKFFMRDMVRIMVDHGIDQRDASEHAKALCEKLRAATRDALRARRELLA